MTSMTSSRPLAARGSFAVLLGVAACQPDIANRGTASFGEGTCTIPEVSQRKGQMRLEVAVQLTDEDGRGMFMPIAASGRPVRDRLDRYWVGQSDEILIFDPSGKYATAVGTRGEGPFEFRDATPFHVDSTGRVHVLDPGNARISVIREDLSLA